VTAVFCFSFPPVSFRRRDHLACAREATEGARAARARGSDPGCWDSRDGRGGRRWFSLEGPGLDGGMYDRTAWQLGCRGVVLSWRGKGCDVLSVGDDLWRLRRVSEAWQVRDVCGVLCQYSCR
jgi:hypothetical protein